MHQEISKFLVVAGVALWLTLTGVGFWHLTAYETTPGTVAARPNLWSKQSALIRDTTLPTLVMVVHPQCPCTRASIRDLARVLAACPGRVRTIVLFVIPSGMSPGWEKTDLWAAASALPGVQVQRDPDGIEADRFGAETSGQCFLFAPDGRRLFSGGITAERGHEGDNRGSDALIALLTGKGVAATHTMVFGCPLQTAYPASHRRLSE